MAGVKLSTVIDAIGALSVTLTNGKALKIQEDSTLPESALRLGGVMFPKPDGFITGLKVEPQTYGSDGAERMDVHYNLTYVFCSTPIGSGRVLSADNYVTVVDDTVLILNAILTNDDISDGIDLRLADVLSFGAVSDPAGNVFYGTEIQLSVTEFYEV